MPSSPPASASLAIDTSISMPVPFCALEIQRRASLSSILQNSPTECGISLIACMPKVYS
eukprot:COSAG02_NODE_153_length_33128_cov_10.471253_25_plen_59_part_00